MPRTRADRGRGRPDDASSLPKRAGSALCSIWRGLTYGLTRKVSLFVLALLTTFTVTFTTVNIIAEQEVVESRLKRSAQSVATMLADLASSSLRRLRMDELQIIVQDIQRREDILYAYVLDAEDKLIADGGVGDDNLLAVIDDPLSRQARASGKGVLVLDQGGLHVVQPLRIEGEFGTVRVGISTDLMRRDIAGLRNRNLMLGAVFLVISLFVSLPLVRRIMRPLEVLTASTEAVSQGRFEQRIGIRTNDEIGTLADAFNRMTSQLRQHDEQIRRLAFFDSVTELPNRVAFRELLGRVVTNARRHGRRGAVLYLDLDRFKLINDTFGHDAGDRLLMGFARRLLSCLRESDAIARASDDAAATVARMGGDEFTIMLAEIGEPEDAARVAGRILAMLEQPFELGDHAVVIGSSIGIALFPDDGDTPEELLKNADAAMYDAKDRGRNVFRFYREPLSARNLQRITLEQDLRVAIEREQLLLDFQPVIDLRTGEVSGFEALLRWNHPLQGPIAPSSFIPLAEETRLIQPIGSWVMDRACAQARTWAGHGLGRCRVSVNLSMSHLQQHDFVDWLGEMMAASGVPPDLLELEITETMVMADPEEAAAKLAAARRLGVALAIDDFGIGRSSLSHLRCFPLDRLKIDRSFIRDMASDADDGAIVAAIIAMAHHLNIEVVAEGVENERQLDLLRRRQCDFVQGPGFSPPLAAKDVVPWYLDWQRRRRASSDSVRFVAGSLVDPALPQGIEP